MGWFGNIRNRLKESRRSTLVLLVAIPFITIGLTFVGIQSYNWLTGRPATPFSFDIGSLWADEANDVEVDEGLVKKTPIVLPVRIRPKSIPGTTAPTPKRVIPKISAKNRAFISTLTVENKSESDKPMSVDLLTFPKFQQVKFDADALNPIKYKYLKRLKQDYLINPEITPDSKKWFVGLSIAPMLSYRTFNFNDAERSGVVIAGDTRYNFGLTRDQRNRTDQSLPSFSFGLDIGRTLSKRLSVKTGFYYATYGEELQIKQANELDPNYNTAVYFNRKPQYEAFSAAPVEESGGIPFTNRYAYFEIPLGIEYKLIKLKNTQLALDLGASFQRLDHVDALVYDVETDYYYWFSEKHDLFRRVGYNTSAGVVVSQYVGNTLELFVSPRMIFNMHSTYSDDFPIIQRQYSSGLKLGFKQHF